MSPLRFAIDIAPLGELSDPRAIVRLACAAEESGWDGLSIWDSLGLSMGTTAADPFVTLAAIAARTERLRSSPPSSRWHGVDRSSSSRLRPRSTS